MFNANAQNINEACKFINNYFDITQNNLPSIGLVLGSGLSNLGEDLKNSPNAKFCKFSSVPYMANSSVQGHKGEIIYGKLGNKQVIALSGRLHFYEGHALQDVVFPIRVMAQLGIKNLILTNASGAIGDNFEPGELMAITDHINFTGQNPLIGKNNAEYGPRFVDMSHAYDKELINLSLNAASKVGITMHTGVYAGLLGPTYETPAEIRMLKLLGAHAVGMSTVFETIVARHMGLRVAGISCLTNKAAGLSSKNINHEEVMEINLKVSEKLSQLIKLMIEDIC